VIAAHISARLEEANRRGGCNEAGLPTHGEANKKPLTMPGLLNFAKREINTWRPHRAAELVVDANAADVRGQVDGMCEHAGGERTNGGDKVGAGCGGPAEIDVEVFGLDRPAVHQGVFRAGAGGPAGPGRGDCRRLRRRRKRIGKIESGLHVGDSETAGAVEQQCGGRQEAGAPTKCV
jgi:hypothetical protein